MKNRIKVSLLVASLMMAVVSFAASTGVKTGKKAPDFTLLDINGASQKLSSYQGKYVVLEWINHGCPFVKKHYDTKNMQSLQKELAGKGVIWLSICSSAEGKEGSMSATGWQIVTKEKEASPTAVLLDKAGEVGKIYGAKTTPHMFIVDPKGVLIYQGAIDDKASYEKEDVPTAKNYVRQALEESMAGKKVSMAETKAYGCSVKY